MLRIIDISIRNKNNFYHILQYVTVFIKSALFVLFIASPLLTYHKIFYSNFLSKNAIGTMLKLEAVWIKS